LSVRHALLALLSDGPKYGLQLQQDFEEKTAEVWPINIGQIYQTLQRLERDGLIEVDDASESEGRQKGFRLTDSGRAELRSWLETPPDNSSPPRDELVMKVLVALGLPWADLQDLLQVHRRHLVELMQRYTHLKADAPEGEIALALVLDAELFRLDSVVRWLDSAEARLRAHPAHSNGADKTAISSGDKR
jgi:DNA-binding PadR family transcriptional regulator